MSKGFAPPCASGKILARSTSQNQSLSKIYKLAFQIMLMTYQTLLVERTKHHLLKDILVIALLAVIAGADGWEDMKNYGISKLTWLQKFLKLPNGIPSDYTFRRVLEKLEPKILEQKLRTWINQLIGSVAQEPSPIDGKSLRWFYDRTKGVKNLHLVTAWASEHRLVLGQVKVEDHSNEITAIPAL